MKAVGVHAWGEALRMEELPEPAFTLGHSFVRMQPATVGQIDRTVWSCAFLKRPLAWPARLAGALDCAQEKG